jgi:PhoPQ-activated pathogenicity-related protein
MKTILRIYFWCVLALLTIPLLASEQKTALDEYVAKPDAAYTFEHVATERRLLYTTYFLTMTSQQWRNSSEVDRPVWEHELSITVPLGSHLEDNRTAILFISGGNNDDPPATKTNEQIAALSVLSQSVVAVVRQVPNQPLHFLEEDPPRPRSEDAVLAYSLRRFLDSCNSKATVCDWEWPVHLAMTKAAVRAMNTVQSFLHQRSVLIKDFVVVGGSKRGWTTWLTAAVDPRVKAIVPISFDMLNMEPQIDRHWAAYGGTYSEALDDYTELNVFCSARGTASGQKLREIIDPYEYRDRLTMPKLIINSAGDQFFLPDSSQLYYKDLLGDNRLRYTFNTDHSQEQVETDILVRAVSWLNDIRRGKTLPSYAWEIQNDTLLVKTSGPVKAVSLWQATDAENPESRDFRLQTIGPVWTKQELQSLGDGRYEAALETPIQGTWTAYSIEVVFKEPSILEANQVFTTDVVVRPNSLPRDPNDHCMNP